MAMSSQQLKNVGTIVGIIVFAGPLAALYFSLSGWDADEALKEKYENDRRRERASGPVRLRKTRAPRKSARRKPPTKPAPEKSRVAGTDTAPAGPVAIELKRLSKYKVEVVFTNVSEDRLWLAVPDGPGGLVRIAAAGAEPERAVVPLYDEERDDYLTRLLAGAAHRIQLKGQSSLPAGPVRAVYDSRGPGVPEKAWRGMVESPPAE